jgi:hypothetical protein
MSRCQKDVPSFIFVKGDDDYLLYPPTHLPERFEVPQLRGFNSNLFNPAIGAPLRTAGKRQQIAECFLKFQDDSTTN